jgi:transcriptional regulator with XRE-family HTH domain
MTVARESFGALVRRDREAMKIGLREMAEKVGISPTYLSLIERDDFDPPAEDKVVRIAEIIGRDPDELLARAGRVASDLTDIIRERPREIAQFLRDAKGLSPDALAYLAWLAREMPDRLSSPRKRADFIRLANYLSEATARLTRLPRQKGLLALLTPPPKAQNAKAMEVERKARVARWTGRRRP